MLCRRVVHLCAERPEANARTAALSAAKVKRTATIHELCRGRRRRRRRSVCDAFASVRMRLTVQSEFDFERLAAYSLNGQRNRAIC